MLSINITMVDLELAQKIDIEEILDEASSFLLQRILARFLAEKDPNDKPWKPSKAGTRRRALGGGGTLFDTGRLFRSIQVSKTGVGKRFIGTDVPYAPRHQLGTEGMVKRSFLGFSNDDVSMVTNIINMRVNEMVNEL